MLLKQLFDSCATKDWSGITGLSGDGVGLPQFEPGKAAMAFAVDFGYGTIAASAHFPIGSMPFPEITTATTKLSANVPARSGNTEGGTSYMIPAHTSGKALKASVLFLQFMSAPQYITKWLAETGGIAAVRGITPPAVHGRLLRGRLGQTGDHQPVCLLRLRHRPGSAVQRGLRRLSTRLENARPGSALLGGPLPPGCRVPCPERRLERPTLGVIATPLPVGSVGGQRADRRGDVLTGGMVSGRESPQGLDLPAGEGAGAVGVLSSSVQAGGGVSAQPASLRPPRHRRTQRGEPRFQVAGRCCGSGQRTRPKA